MDISIIIPNYKSQQFLLCCIESIQKKLLAVSHEIIIINNDSQSIETIAPGARITIINNPTNEGFAKACNKAAIIAKGEILFFLNPDTEFISGKITDLIDLFKNPNVGVVSPRILTEPGEIQPWSNGFEITLLGILFNNLGFIRSKKLWKVNNKINPDWVSGAALAIRSTLFKKINGFDENFFMYFEDADLCKKVKNNNKEILVIPSIEILHIGGQSFTGKTQQKKYYYQSQDYYFKKHLGLLSFYILRLLRIIYFTLKKT